MYMIYPITEFLNKCWNRGLVLWFTHCGQVNKPWVNFNLPPCEFPICSGHVMHMIYYTGIINWRRGTNISFKIFQICLGYLHHKYHRAINLQTGNSSGGKNFEGVYNIIEKKKLSFFSANSKLCYAYIFTSARFRGLKNWTEYKYCSNFLKGLTYENLSVFL